MRLTDILSPDRIVVDPDGSAVRDKEEALRIMARLLAPAIESKQETIHQLLFDREQLQSTGIGDGVAIPHTSIASAPGQAAALLLCPQGISFDAIDGGDVHIIFGVIGPRRATGEHLRTLARISRLLRNEATRSQLVRTHSPSEAYRLIQSQDASLN